MIAIFLQVGSLEHVFLFEDDHYTHRGSETQLKSNQDPLTDSNSTIMHLKEETCVCATTKTLSLYCTDCTLSSYNYSYFHSLLHRSASLSSRDNSSDLSAIHLQPIPAGTNSGP